MLGDERHTGMTSARRDDTLLVHFRSDINGLYEVEESLTQETDLQFEIFRTNVRALLSYKPQFYPGRITFFRASEQIADIADPVKDWRNVAAEGVEVHVVPGDHYTMLREPAVQIMAEWLKVCIELTSSELNTISV